MIELSQYPPPSHLSALQVRYLLIGEDCLRQRGVKTPGDARALAGLVEERHLHAVDYQRRLRAARPARENQFIGDSCPKFQIRILNQNTH